MKKTYIAPDILVTEVKTTIMAGSGPETVSDTPYEGSLTGARSRRHNIEWIEDDDDDM